MPGYLRHPQPKHAISTIVALGVVGLALADGGAAPLAYSVTALATWGFVLVGIAAGFLPRERPGRAAIATGAALAALALITALSAIWAADPGSAFDEGVVALAHAGVFVVCVLGSRRGEARSWLGGLAVGLGAVAVLALGARFEPSLFGEGERELIGELAAAEGRLSDPFLYWNALAAALAAGTVLCVWLGATAATRARRAAAIAVLPAILLALYMTGSRGGAGAAVAGILILLGAGPWRTRIGGAVLLGVLPGAALIAFATTRSELLDHPLTEVARDQVGSVELALLGAVALAATLAYALDPIVRAARVPDLRLNRAQGIGLAAVALAAAAALILIADPGERWEEFKAPPAAPGAEDARGLRVGSSARYQFWSAAVDAFEHAPLKGVGSAGFEYWWNQHGSLPDPGPNGHSLLFDTAAELGVLGLLAVLGFAGIALATGLARVREGGRVAAPTLGVPADPGAIAAALAVLVTGLAGTAIDWIWENPAAFSASLVAAALLTGPAGELAPPGEAAPAGTRRARRRFAGGIVVLAFAWVAICAAALLMLTNLSLDRSRDAVAAGDLATAESRARDAVDLQPWDAEPRQQLGLVLEQAGDLERARAAVGEAIERSSLDWRLRLIAARIALSAGAEAQARAHAGEARSLGPMLPPLDRPLAEILDGLR